MYGDTVSIQWTKLLWGTYRSHIIPSVFLSLRFDNKVLTLSFIEGLCFPGVRQTYRDRHVVSI